MPATDGRATVMVDARWSGYTGVGRVTDLFLRGLTELHTSTLWRVWTRRGQGLVRECPALETVATGHLPTALLAQRDLPAVPAADKHLWLHAVRPLTKRATAVVVHDLIPMSRYPQPQRTLWRAFFRRSVALADRILVYSDETSSRVQEMLGADPDRIARFDLTIDTGLADRIREMRAGDVGRDRKHLLYVGQFKAHKNLDRALQAFAQSRAAASGVAFVLVGGVGTECQRLHEKAHDLNLRNVRVMERCSDEELVSLYAGAGALVQPSLEEGFGLTVLEALVAGVPVACSTIPTHRDASRGEATFFDPRDVHEMSTALDHALAAPMPERPAVPTLPEFARGLLRAAGLN